MTDRWEDAFDTWMPQPETADTDTGVDLDREELLRLARELAAQRNVEQERVHRELEQLKESLRERAAAVAERERELAELQRQLEKGKARKAARQPQQPVDADAIAARERAALERLQAVEAREAELQQRALELAEESATLAPLQAELDAAREELERSQTDRRLAAAERERLEERLEEARRAEKELAALRVELERRREEIEARERKVTAATAAAAEDTQPDPYEERENELQRLEARLEARERELALLRQGLDAQRIELHERERVLRRREVAEVRKTFDAPFTAPSFSEGLASFVSSRSRR